MDNGDTRVSPAPYSAFAPLLIALIGLIVLLSWNLRLTLRQTSNLQIAKAQLGQVSLQSAQTEEKLKAMLTDLLVLAPDNSDAADIVKRYGIKQNGPIAAAPTAGKSE
jgi:hypothetical protein